MPPSLEGIFSCRERRQQLWVHVYAGTERPRVVIGGITRDGKPISRSPSLTDASSWEERARIVERQIAEVAAWVFPPQKAPKKIREIFCR